MSTKPVRCLFLVAASIVLAYAVAFAETIDVKLGLWEVTTTTESQGLPTFAMGDLTPEQRAKLEASMKASQAGPPKVHTTKSCLTKEKLEKDFLEDNDLKDNCKRTNFTSTSKEMDVKAVCTGKIPATVEMHFVAATPESVNGTMKMRMGDGGQAMTVDSKIAGKWISADCGDVK